MTKVVLTGLGAIGMTYAVKLHDKCDLSILADEERINRYKQTPPVFNGVEQKFKYITPKDGFDADFIIICTKAQGLNDAIKNISNFVTPNAVIISLINGISSEEQIKHTYPMAKVLKSYFIGHSALREGNSVTQDGVGELVIGHNAQIEDFFTSAGVNYRVVEDIEYSMWLKYTFNLFSNQVSAILDLNFGELKRNGQFLDFAKKIINEVRLIAEAKGIKNTENLEKDAIASLDKMCDEGKTSMLQDILAKRPTEVDIFAGEIIRLGKKYGIPTPCNSILYDLIKIKEEANEHSIHTR